MSLMQPFTPEQQTYLNEVQTNIRAAMDALQKELNDLRPQVEEGTS